MTTFELWTSLETARSLVRERRTSTRYPLQLPVRVVAVDRKTVDAAACTQNMSSKGVLLHCSLDCRVGQQLDYVIELSADASVCLKCKGRVVRLDPPEAEPPVPATCRLAATLEVYEYVRRTRGGMAESGKAGM